MRNFSDEELARLSLNNPECYNILALKYRPFLCRFLARKYLREAEWVEDIAQEALVRAYLNLNKFDPQRRWSTWLFGIAINLANSDLVRPKSISFEESYMPMVFLSEARIESALQLRRIAKAIASLPEQQSYILRVYLLEDASVEEIAGKIKKPVFEIKNRIRFALRMLALKYYIES